ncbi:MAG: hypothetical protein AB7O48_12920 [Cyclobacteriaceae bacterium]
MQMKLIAIVVTALVVLIAIFYVALKDTKQNVSVNEPYASLIGKTLIVEQDVVLARNLAQFKMFEDNFISEEANLYEGVEKIRTIKSGTSFTFTNAFHYRNAVSGVTHSVLIGKIKDQQPPVSFEYSWGSYHSICVEEPCDYWTFPLGFWQQTPDDKKYTINYDD